MILNNIKNLINEVESFSTLDRVFRYGPVKTFSLWIYRTLNAEVLEYFEPLLGKIDEAIDYYEKTDYKATKYINKVDLGEMVNVSKLKDDADTALATLKNCFEALNGFISSLFKCYIDEMVDNDIKINNITTVSSLLAIKSNLKSKSILTDIIDIYTNMLSKKPTSAINILSDLKRVYINSKFISEISSDLDSQVTKYIAKKLEMSPSSSIIRNSQI